MKVFDFVSEAIITENRRIIDSIIDFYGEICVLPAYIKIRVDPIEEKTNIMPFEELAVYFTLSGCEDQWWYWSAINLRKLQETLDRDYLDKALLSIGINDSDIFWEEYCDPHKLMSMIHVEESEEHKLFQTLTPYTGMVIIEYGTSEKITTFNPVVISLKD